MGKIYKDDVGVLIRLNTGVDVSEAESIKIRVRLPDGATTEWDAEEDETTNYIKYLTVAGDLEDDGDYLLQAYVTWGSTSIHRGETYTLTVYEYYE